MRAAGRAEPWGRARRRRGAQLAPGAARPRRRKVSPAPRDERRSLGHGRAPQPRPRSGRLRRGGAHRGAGARGRRATARRARRRECPLLCPSNFLGGATRGDATASAPYPGDNLEASRLCHRSVRDGGGEHRRDGSPPNASARTPPRSGSRGFTAGHSPRPLRREPVGCRAPSPRLVQCPGHGVFLQRRPRHCSDSPSPPLSDLRTLQAWGRHRRRRCPVSEQRRPTGLETPSRLPD